MARTILLDGDIYLFRAAAAVEHTIQWGDEWEGLSTAHSHFDEALEVFERSIEQIQTGLQTDNMVVALTSPVNFRKEVMPTYKQHRIGKRKPTSYAALREHVRQEYSTFEREGLEADDVLGILSTHSSIIPGERIIVSIDKDMGSIPGKWLNDKRAREAIDEVGGTFDDFVQEITEEQADWYHMLQTLMGDASDGYPGCPGVGEVGAEKLLAAGVVLRCVDHEMTRGPRKGELEKRWVSGDPGGTVWEIVVSAYAKAGLSEEVALENARVARICRAEDWNAKKKTVNLWTP